jgi:hypothetical protein
MRSTITRRVVAGISAAAAVAATTIVLIGPGAADAGRSLHSGRSLTATHSAVTGRSL